MTGGRDFRGLGAYWQHEPYPAPTGGYSVPLGGGRVHVAIPVHHPALNMPTRRKRPRDFNQAAKLVIDIATGTIKDSPTPTNDGTKSPEAVALGTLGGRKGGKARAASLSPERRKEIARLAASSRWKKPR